MQQVNTNLPKVEEQIKEKLSKKRILVLHPFLKFYGGAEYMLGEILNRSLPNADIFTLAYKKEILQKLGITNRHIISPLKDSPLSFFYREASFFYPALMETYNFSNYDIIISHSYAYVHAAITSPGQQHLSIIMTPMRAIWLETTNYWVANIPILGNMYAHVLSNQRLWDTVAATRPDKVFAISHDVQQRIKSLWGINAGLLYPPVDVDAYKTNDVVSKKDYYITHSRLVYHKRIDIMIEAFKKLKRTLYILGEGREETRLKKLAGNSKFIVFKHFVSEEEKKKLIQEAKGYIFAAFEDFGISPLEAIAAGVPVLAYRKGAVVETIKENISGMFFSEQTVDSLTESFYLFERAIEEHMFDKNKMYDSVKQFSIKNFQKNFLHLLSDNLSL